MCAGEIFVTDLEVKKQKQNIHNCMDTNPAL